MEGEEEGKGRRERKGRGEEEWRGNGGGGGGREGRKGREGGKRKVKFQMWEVTYIFNKSNFFCIYSGENGRFLGMSSVFYVYSLGFVFLFHTVFSRVTQA